MIELNLQITSAEIYESGVYRLRYLLFNKGVAELNNYMMTRNQQRNNMYRHSKKRKDPKAGIVRTYAHTHENVSYVNELLEHKYKYFQNLSYERQHSDQQTKFCFQIMNHHKCLMICNLEYHLKNLCLVNYKSFYHATVYYNHR